MIFTGKTSHTRQKELFHSIILSYFQPPSEASSLGVEYFQENLFGYTVYSLLGFFIVILIVGLIWEYSLQAQKEHKLKTDSGN